MNDPHPTTEPVDPAEVCEQFCRYVDRIHGVYLDATMAMGGMASWYMKMDRDRWPQLEKSTELVTWDVLNPEIVYGGMVRGKGGDLHRARLHDIIHRNSPDGSNWQFLALMCVVGLYQLWEDYFRPALAKSLGKQPENLRADVFGELRHLRRSIVHRNGYATAAVARAKLTRAFAEDTPIILEPQDMHDLVDLTKEAVRGFVLPTTPAA